MIKDLYIENFRGFDKLKIDNIKKINFLVGKNNCGKTSVLEAITLITGIGISSDILLHINRNRNILLEENNFKHLFYNFNYKNNIILKSNNSEQNLIIKSLYNNKTLNSINNLKLTLAIQEKNKKTLSNFYTDEGFVLGNMKYKKNIKGIFISNVPNFDLLIENLINIIINKKISTLINLIYFFNRKIKSIQLVDDEVFLDVEGINELISLNLMGDGLKKYLSIIIPIVENEYNIVLVDEIENGLHHKTIKHLLRSILNLSKNNDIQMFFTTHSYEVLKFLSEIVNDEFKDIKDTINVINIVNTENKGFQSYNYDMDSVKELLENDSDIRY